MATPSALGLFEKLPPEARSCIWDYLVPLDLSRLSEENERYGKSKRPGTRLAVMCTSRTLHEEISHYLYGNFQIRVHIASYNALDPWIWFEIRRIRGIWQLASVDEAITRAFGEFPFHNVHLTITLLAKKVSDKGQMVMLWEKLNRFIFFLSVRRPIKSITLVFLKGSGVWLRAQRHHKRTNGYEHEALALQLFPSRELPRDPHTASGK